MEKYQEKFNKTVTTALLETGAPVWERKKRVSKAREARLVVTVEVRDLLKEVAKRNNTNLQTVVWLAAHGLWKELQYSRADYNKIMFSHSSLKTLPDEDDKDLAEFFRSTGVLNDGTDSSKTDLDVATTKQLWDRLNPEQKRQLVELIESKRW